MTSYTVPLQPVPNQTFNIILGGQYCAINLYQKSTGLFFDLSMNDVSVITCRICRNRVNLLGHTYFGFKGDFQFQDQQGKDDPEYSGLGSRYLFKYLP